jgi:Tol biopolymer transport system component/tRNA A-37 threonylcarbamoyl transferase component Bud32
MSDVVAELNASLRDRYVVEEEIGQGGMATVYLARDVRHDRSVAIKVLHPELAAVLGGERFVTEMKVTASLQHPHILPLFDSGTAQGQLFYVMPVVEGESLRERLAREQQLSIEEAVRITTEVAGALDYAHRHGVVHRDIKPENILLHDGTALVADFGIALAVSNAGGVRLTQTGLSLGTPQYMSPEQATGERSIDGRTDIYSLGCVLYEMLAGEPPFSGGSAQAIVARVLTESARPIRGRRDTVSPGLEAAVLKALQRLPADRYATASAFAEALKTGERMPVGSGQGASSPAPASSAGRRGLRLVAGLVVGAALLFGAYRLGAYHAASNEGSTTAWVAERVGGPPVAMVPRVSPDGKTVAFAAMVDGQAQLAVLNPESGDWRVLTRDTTRGFAGEFAWSPDGTRIYYSRFNEGLQGVFSITPLGTDDRLVLDHAGGPQVLPDGSLLVDRLNADRRLQLYRYRPQSGGLDTLPASSTFNWGQDFFRVFPDGKEAAFFGVPGAHAGGPDALYAIDLDTKAVRELSDASGLIVRGGSSFGVAADGRAVLMTRRVGDGYDVVSIPRDGSGGVTTVLSSTSQISDVDAGPDGSIYVDQLQRPCVWFTYDPRGRHLETYDLLPECDDNLLPLPDGRILTSTESGGRERLVTIRPGTLAVPFLGTDAPAKGPAAMLGGDRVMAWSGANLDTLLIASAVDGRIEGRIPGFGDVTEFVGSPDGRTIYFARAGGIWSMPASGGTPKRLRDGDDVAVDPGGRYLVVETNAADRVHLFHVPLDGTAEREIPVHGRIPLSPQAIIPDAVAADGRILVTAVSPALWHWPAGILDPKTGKLELLPTGPDYDVTAAWTPDGRIVAVGDALAGSLWRFRPAKKEIAK